jgi:hypothetical protein
MEFVNRQTGKPLVRPQLRPFVSSHQITGDTNHIGYTLKQMRSSDLQKLLDTVRIGQYWKLSITQAQLDSFVERLDTIILDLEADLQSNPATQFDPPYTRVELISSWPAGQLYHRHLLRQQEQQELDMHVQHIKEEEGLANYFIDPDERNTSPTRVKRERDDDESEPHAKRQVL